MAKLSHSKVRMNTQGTYRGAVVQASPSSPLSIVIRRGGNDSLRVNSVPLPEEMRGFLCGEDASEANSPWKLESNSGHRESSIAVQRRRRSKCKFTQVVHVVSTLCPRCYVHGDYRTESYKRWRGGEVKRGTMLEVRAQIPRYRRDTHGRTAGPPGTEYLAGFSVGRSSQLYEVGTSRVWGDQC